MRGPFSIVYVFRYVRRAVRERGMGALSEMVSNAILLLKAGKLTSATKAQFSMIDIVSFFSFVYKPTPLPVVTSAKITPGVTWLVPDFGIGSGGHLNIFRFVLMLEARGILNQIVIVGDCRHASAQGAKQIIVDNFSPISADVHIGLNCDIEHTSVVIATSWITAYYCRQITWIASPYYFVQDFEPVFYPAGGEYAMAEQTYRFGFKGLAFGSWISNMLLEKYAMPSCTLGFSYDPNLYGPTPRREPNQKRVFFYARPPTARRGFELGILALELVARARPDVHFIFAGWDMGQYYFPHVHLNCGILDQKELPDLYSQCDVALVLSFSNMSLLPYELMACGCAVVTNEDDCATWGLPRGTAATTASSPEEISETIIRLLANDSERKLQIDAAMHFVGTTSWQVEGAKLADALSGDCIL